MKRAICLILLLSIVFAFALGGCAKEPGVPTSDNLSPPLYFNEDGEFTVVQFADFHEWAAVEKSMVSLELKDTLKPLLAQYIRDVIDAAKPDFVVLTGDNIFCRSWMDSLYNVSERTISLMADIFEEKQVYWTFTFGNHDTEGGVTKEKFINAVKDYKFFIGGLESGMYYDALTFEASEDDFRAGNYSIPIYGADMTSVAYNLFVLDSGSYTSPPKSSVPYRYILDRQTDWYADRAEALKTANGGNPVPSVMFTHIPLLEHREAYNQGGEQIGVWAGISPSDTRSKIFAKAMETGDVRGIFAGHNHNNSYTGFYTLADRKIMMGITPQASADGYDDTSSVLYSRVIRLKQDGGLSTYIDTSDTQTYPDRVYKAQYLNY